MFSLKMLFKKNNRGSLREARSNRRQLGMSLLEIIIGLLIITTVLASVSRVYQLLMRRYHLGLTEQYLLHRLAQLADSITIALDSHPLPDLIRTHADGEMRYLDGSKINLNQPIASNSNAITLGRLDFMETILNKKLTFSTGNVVTIDGCGLSPTLSEIVNFRRFLIFHPDGYSEGLGALKKVSTNCVIGSLYLNKAILASAFHSVSSSTRASQIATSIFVVPLAELLTFYLDESGTVRLLNHEGERIIENQPLFNGAKELKFKLHQLKAGLLPALEIWVKTNQGREFTIFREGSLVRGHPVGLYLQLAGVFRQQVLLRR